MNVHPKLILVLGGAASGKSDVAEALVSQSGKTRVYLATAEAFDDEMRHKIDRHIRRRGPGWRTVEAPMDAAAVLNELSAGDICLLDCATLWLSNQMLAETDLAAAQKALLTALAQSPADVIVVTNEVGHGVVPDHKLARAFREAQGRLNIALAAQADTVIQVTVGLPQVLKGELP